MEKIYEAAGTIFGTLILFLISKKPLSNWIQKNRIKNFRNGLQVSEQINHILTEIRSRYSFNRVSIVDYHNGTTSFGGFSLKFGSMTFESTDESTKNIITEYQNIPTSLCSEMLIDLEGKKEGYVIVTNNNYNEGVQIENTMFGIERSHNFRIGNSLINGMLQCVWTNSEYQKITIKEEDVIWIKGQIQKIMLLRDSAK